MKSKKRILVAPLDWGIGHATRCIPLIKELIKHKYEVIIAANNRPLHLLIKEFPKLEFIRFPGYNVTYSRFINMKIAIMLQIPKLFITIKKETKLLDKIITDYNIDGVISNNRFGLSTKKIPCVFITHQLKIQTPFMSSIVQRINYNYIKKYNSCWIIDSKKNNLAGILSKPKKIPEN